MTHEVGETARTLIDRLGGNPLGLAMVAMNLGLLGFLYYNEVHHTTERREEMKLLYENRDKMAQLLFKCVPPTSDQQR